MENINDDKKKKTNKVLKVFLIILISFLIVIISTITTIFFYLNHKLDKIKYSDLTKGDLDIDSAIDSQLSNYRNIAILGIDARADTFSPGNRSDCIMILSINKTTHDVKIASVYRDMYLDIDNRGLDKVTHAYSFGGPQLALNTLNKNLDLNISEFIAINFDSVRTAVDCVEGVTITLDSDEVKYINGYIDALNSQFQSSSANITTAGTYTLDGVQALAYGRIRYTSGGDYKRTERMRNVLLAVFDKAKNEDFSDLNKFLDIMLPHVYTNISKNKIMEEIPQIKSYSVKNNFGWPDVSMVDGRLINKIWYGVPVDLEQSVSKLHKDLFDEQNYNPSDRVKNISNSIKEKVKNSN
ncbi:MAG: LCP family protein [Clostridia bacterium]|nr:LCP family protein [Clostridia bacterium]